MDFKKFDNKFDLDGLKKDIQEAKENGGNYEEVPCGTYEVKIEKLELTESKKGDPMFKVQFRILAGEHKKQCIFMNQLITQGFQINIVNEFLKALDSGIDVYFESFTQYNDLILDIHEAIDGKLEYSLKYDENNKGYKTFEIVDIYEV